MATITEDYVSFETAKLLKEKGFKGYSIFTIYDENAANAYFKELEEKHLPHCSDDPKLKEFYYTKPTLQMAMKWLRDVHHLFIWISLNPSKALPYYYQVFRTDKPENYVIYIDSNFYGSYEMVCDSAIKYCSENLI